jgi:hypothetical protein
MKKITLLSLFCFCAFISSAQVDSLNENFDVQCATSAFPYSDHWQFFNPVPASIPSGEWKCTSTNGRGSTPGIECTGVYSSSYHLDTSYLVTPELNLSGRLGSVLYLDFDAKTDSLVLGGELRVLVTIDTPFSSTDAFIDLTDSASPAIGVMDSAGWVTHQINITHFKDSGDFYLTFRYTSTDTTGSLWFLDNINITSVPLPLLVANTGSGRLPLTVTGNSTTEHIALSYSVPIAGMYEIAVYDMPGRQVYKQMVEAQSGKTNYDITGLDLHPGMYFIKMDNGINYGVVKTIVQ